MKYLVKFSGEIDLSDQDYSINSESEARKEAEYLLNDINGGFWGKVFENVKITEIVEQ